MAIVKIDIQSQRGSYKEPHVRVRHEFIAVGEKALAEALCSARDSFNYLVDISTDNEAPEAGTDG